MEEAQFRSSLDLMKEVLIFAWKWVEDACACVCPQEGRLKQLDQRLKDQFVPARQT
jgi:hypothetical protein